MIGQQIAVVGATGFTGERLVRRLAAEGHRVTAVVRTSSMRSRIAKEAHRFAEADLRRAGEMEAALRGHDALVHVASLGFDEAPSYVSAVERSGIRRAVFTSTTAILTRLPVRSKPVREAAERAIERSALDWTIIRPTMIYGTDRDRNVSRLLRFIRRYRCMVLPGGGGAMQQPVHVDDVVDAAVLALASSRSVGRSYNISGASPITFRQLVETAASAVGVRAALVPLPVGALAAAVGMLERLGVPVRVRPEQILRIAEDKSFDHSEAVRDLGFRARSFDSGVAEEAMLLGLSRGVRG